MVLTALSRYASCSLLSGLCFSGAEVGFSKGASALRHADVDMEAR